MIDRSKFSMLYWDLTTLPDTDLQEFIDTIVKLKDYVFFKKIIIVADESVIPAKIMSIASKDLRADLYVPSSVEINNRSSNTIHKGHFVDQIDLKNYIWQDEQLISIGSDFSEGISIGKTNSYDISYHNFLNEFENIFIQ